jgi:hypothetical protein
MFDEEPDGDPHGECALEITRLKGALIAIRHRCRSDPADFETAVLDVQFAYHIANNCLTLHDCDPQERPKESA